MKSLVLRSFSAIALIATLIAAPVASAQQPAPKHSTKVVLLGTGNPAADPDRSGPATAIVVNDVAYLVDFGPGVVRRAKAAVIERGVTALEPTSLRVAFVTHLHSDHTVGYPDLIFSPWTLGRRMPIEVYGPSGLKAMTTHLMEAYRVDIETRTNADGNQHDFPEGHKVNAHEIRAGVVYKDAERDRHRVPDEARDGKLRLSLRDGRSQHRHLRRHQSDPSDDRRLQRLRRADSRGEHARVGWRSATRVSRRSPPSTTPRRRSSRSWRRRQGRGCSSSITTRSR